MEQAPLCFMTPKEVFSESLEIKHNQKLYKLRIEIEEQNISLNLSEEKELFIEYGIQLNLEELKKIHKLFSTFSTCQEFLEYIKVLREHDKLLIEKGNENNISIEIIVEYLYKENTVKIDLEPKNTNLNIVVKDMYKELLTVKEKLKEMENNYRVLKEENKLLKEQNTKMQEKSIKNENDIKKLEEKFDNFIQNSKQEISIKNNETLLLDSSIIKEGEFDMIKTEIEEKMKMKIKGINKLYQATFDGGETINFHKKCDNIKNTLIFYESKGNRRFGAFASESWGLREKEEEKPDKNCFLFSLDKHKIFSIENGNYYNICCSSDRGPSFARNGTYCIELYRNAFDEKSLRTVESIHEDIFGSVKNILSEDGLYHGVYCKEYEVFQIIFY